MVVGSDGGVMRGCGDPFWETVEQAYRSCSVLVGCKCSCRDHDGGLAAIQDGAAVQMRALRLLPGT